MQRRSTYLPPHRPLHAASVRSKSRTEIISVPALAACQAHLPDGGAHVVNVGAEGATAEDPPRLLPSRAHAGPMSAS